MSIKKVAVISTGNGGQSFAAFLALRGYDVKLYGRDPERVEMFKSNWFSLDGVAQGRAAVSLISSDMAAVIEDTEVILITTPSQYHSVVARDMAAHVTDSQTVVLNPGRTFGTAEFTNTLRIHGCKASPVIAEAETLIFTCRADELAHPRVFSIKHDMHVAAHRPEDTQRVADIMSELFGVPVLAAKNVVQTGMSNIGMIFHPVPILMNLTRMERKERFLYYHEAISPIVADLIERMDRERVAVAKRLGVDVKSALEWLCSTYGSSGNSLYEALQNTVAYNEVYAPHDINTRYVFEDVSTGCVPVSVVAKLIGVDTPIINSVINWATTVYDYDFYRHGRNDEALGIHNYIGALGSAIT